MWSSDNSSRRLLKAKKEGRKIYKPYVNVACMCFIFTWQDLDYDCHKRLHIFTYGCKLWAHVCSWEKWKDGGAAFLATLKVIGLAQSHRFIFYCLGNMEMIIHTHTPTTNSDSPSALPFPCLFTRRLHNSLLCHTRISITCFMMQSQ